MHIRRALDIARRFILPEVLLFALAKAHFASGQTPTTNTDLQAQVSALTNQVAAMSTNVTMLTTNFQQLLGKMTNVDAISSPFFHAEIGTVLLRPFSISQYQSSPTTYQLKLGGSDLRGMIQTVYENRCAWRHDADSPDKLPQGFIWDSNSWPHGKYPLDLEVRLGYAFSGGGSQSSSTSGSGDFYGDVSLGLPFWASFAPHDTNSLGLSQSVNLEAFGSFASDAQYSEVHPAGGLGLAYVAGIPWTKTEKLQLMFRFGYGFVGTPDIFGSTTNNPTEPIIGANTDGSPRFTTMGATDLSAELRMPIALPSSPTSFGYLSLGGNGYKFSGREPDQWSLYIAVSYSLEKLVSAVIPGK